MKSRAPESLAVEELSEVCDADGSTNRPNSAPAEETAIKRTDCGVDEEDAVADQGRQQKPEVWCPLPETACNRGRGRGSSVGWDGPYRRGRGRGTGPGRPSPVHLLSCAHQPA